MDARPKITIDLNDYGFDGEIVMEQLTFRRQTELKDAMSRYYKYDRNGTPTNIMAGAGEVLTVLAFVTKAPFDCKSVDDFLRFTDKLDAIELGKGSELFDRMKSEADAIKRGETSPFVKSDSSQTGTSE